jgi:glutamine amidotransferase-like uncharacterized protein
MDESISQQNGKICSKVFLVIILFLLSITLFNPDNIVVAQTEENLEGMQVRVYEGGIDQKNVASKTALFHMFQWMNANVDWINAQDILEGELEKVDLLAMPAISPYRINDESVSAGGNLYEVRTMIQKFIQNGGAYFGIYGGRYFEWSGYPLFEVRLTFPNPDVSSNEYIAEININIAAGGPNLSSKNETMSMLTWNPGYFTSYGETKIITIATYPENGLPAMACFNYGNGRVFVSSPHPEHEENSERDGTTFYDYLDDPDSEWSLLLTVSKWLVDKTDIIIFWSTVSIFGSVFILALGYYILKRKKSRKS